MERFLYEAEKRCKEYGQENKIYRACIEGAIERLRDALDVEVTMAKRKPTDWGVTAETLVAERNRDALRRDNERLREVIGQTASELRELSEWTIADVTGGVAGEEA